ncbi:ADP-heptose--LPS heptosyltransferase II [Fulvitalea axinellae]|uniref:ADP-heptose--LPS heptosyltransferase II n=1 Tax=Fulvitalea axinellae TaxID=1182444 RepID=A0AAU9CAT5_9BACT|nr:ADP-heptose--LPS heptosyltransferase II [Fulvitalea axinellae]
MKNRAPYKILVVQTAFIGDAILASAILEKLHEHYPDAYIDYLVRKGNEGLFKGHPFIRETIVFDKKNGKYKNFLQLIGKIRDNKYDLLFNAQRFLTTGLITAFSGAGVTVGFDKNPMSFLFSKKIKHTISAYQEGDSETTVHETDRNHALISEFTDEKTAKPRLYPTESDFDAVEKFKQGKYICMAPTSVWFTKQFPKDKWAELLGALPNDFNVYLLGAPSDKEECQAIIEVSDNKNITNLAGELSLLQSAALMKDAKMNYVNDSAPMHLCSSVDAPVCAIYCSTIPGFGFGPLSDESYIVETKEKLKCRPCGLHGHKACPEGHFKCAYGIDKNNLLQVLHKRS